MKTLSQLFTNLSEINKQIADELAKMEGLNPSPQPEIDKPVEEKKPDAPLDDSEITIVMPEADKQFDKMKLGVGHHINLHALVLKNGKPVSGIPVIVDTPHSSLTSFSADNGIVPARKTIQVDGGMRIIFTLKNDPSKSISYTIRDNQGNYPESGTGGKVDGGEKPPASDPVSIGNPNPPKPPARSYNAILPPKNDSPKPGGTSVLVMPLDGHYIDFKLNDTWYKFGNYNAKMVGGDAKGVVIHLPGPLRKFELNPNQIWYPHLNMWGFGWKLIKMQQRHPDMDLHSPHRGRENEIQHWANSYGGAGQLRGTSGFNNTLQPSPTFYDWNVDAPYNGTGKITVWLMGQNTYRDEFDDNNNYIGK